MNKGLYPKYIITRTDGKPLICAMPRKDAWEEVLEAFGLKLKK